MYKVLVSFKGSHDGFTVLTFVKGDVVGSDKLHGDLLDVAKKEKWVEVDKNKQAAKKEQKDEEKAAAKAALEADLEKLNQDLTGADADSKANIEAEIISKQAELDALN